MKSHLSPCVVLPSCLMLKVRAASLRVTPHWGLSRLSFCRATSSFLCKGSREEMCHLKCYLLHSSVMSWYKDCCNIESWVKLITINYRLFFFMSLQHHCTVIVSAGLSLVELCMLSAGKGQNDKDVTTYLRKVPCPAT